ncbi:U4/U6.U5 tri-snRNP-associated protein 2, variant 2 [Balamuthia mandrillaris]
MQTAPQHKRKREEAEQRESTHKGKEKESSTSTNEEEEEQPSVIWQRPRKDSNTDVACPYLDTIRRNLLDFDFEKVCSVTSSNINVYCCLVCGKYFQGRGRNSQAYFHSLSSDHHVFINLHNEKVYCLPDDYEVDDHSLDDIKYVLHPRFSQQQIAHLDKNTSLSASLDGTVYLPGIVGLNNINNNDYINSIVQCLVHVPPLRNFFLREENYQNSKSHLVHTFGDLVRKMWNPRNFKGHVSPHELLQAVSSASNKHFKIGQQGDPLEFLSWLLNTLHKELGGTRKLGSSIIHQVFQGSVCVTTKPLAIKKEEMQISNNSSIEQLMKETTTKVSPFLFLSLDIPPAPLFKSEEEKTVIPQLPLFHCLQKFDGKTEYVSFK